MEDFQDDNCHRKSKSSRTQSAPPNIDKTQNFDIGLGYYVNRCIIFLEFSTMQNFWNKFWYDFDWKYQKLRWKEFPVIALWSQFSSEKKLAEKTYFMSRHSLLEFIEYKTYCGFHLIADISIVPLLSLLSFHILLHRKSRQKAHTKVVSFSD